MLNRVLTGLIIMLASASLNAEEIDSLQTMQDMVSEKVMAQLELKNTSNGRYQVEVGSFDSRTKLNVCEHELQIEFDHQRLNQSQLTAKVICDAPKWIVRLPVKIQYLKQVVVSTRPLMRGEVITANDIRVTEQNVRSATESYFEMINEVEDMMVQRSVPEGTIITQYMIKKPILIHRGDPVKIVYEAPGLTIESSGIAQSEGSKNQMIKIKNTRSNLMIDAMVKDKGIASIPL